MWCAEPTMSSSSFLTQAIIDATSKRNNNANKIEPNTEQWDIEMA